MGCSAKNMDELNESEARLKLTCDTDTYTVLYYAVTTRNEGARQLLQQSLR